MPPASLKEDEGFVCVACVEELKLTGHDAAAKLNADARQVYNAGRTSRSVMPDEDRRDKGLFDRPVEVFEPSSALSASSTSSTTPARATRSSIDNDARSPAASIDFFSTSSTNESSQSDATPTKSASARVLKRMELAAAAASSSPHSASTDAAFEIIVQALTNEMAQARELPSASHLLRL